MALLTNINGKFSVSDAGAVTFNNAFTFPTADGTANYVLKTNGAGQLAWAADSYENYNYWVLQGDSAANININSTNTLKFVGGTYIDTSATWAGGSNARKLTINHETTSRTDTTSTDAPAFGGTFEAVTSVTTNTTGHVTAIDVSTVTIPTDPGGTVKGTGTATRVAFWSASDTITSDADLYWDNTNKRLGIGTTTPAVKLQVYGSAMPATGDAASVEDMFTLYRNGSATVWAGGATLALGRYSTGGGSAPKSRLDFKLKNAAGSNTDLPETTVMTMQSNGNVGIGTVSPDAILNISKTSFSTTFTSADSYIRIGKGENATNGYQFIGFGYNNGSADLVPAYIGYQQTGAPGNYTKGDLVFGTRNVTTNTAPTERMRITSDGMVGIGMTPSAVGSSTYVLQLYNPGSQCFLSLGNGTSGNGPINGLVIGNDVSNAYIVNREATSLIFATSDANRMTILAGGNVGINTTNPDNKLTVKDANCIIDAQSTADSQTIGFRAGYLNNADLCGFFRYTTADAQLYIDNNFTGNNGLYSDINLEIKHLTEPL